MQRMCIVMLFAGHALLLFALLTESYLEGAPCLDTVLTIIVMFVSLSQSSRHTEMSCCFVRRKISIRSVYTRHLPVQSAYCCKGYMTDALIVCVCRPAGILHVTHSIN